MVLLVARTYALSAGSGRVAGSLRRAGDDLTIDVEGTASGTNQRLYLTREGAGTAEVLTVGNDYWLGGDEAFWKTGRHD